jgi:hypothetical protein
MIYSSAQKRNINIKISGVAERATEGKREMGWSFTRREASQTESGSRAHAELCPLLESPSSVTK